MCRIHVEKPPAIPVGELTLQYSLGVIRYKLHAGGADVIHEFAPKLPNSMPMFEKFDNRVLVGPRECLPAEPHNSVEQSPAVLACWSTKKSSHRLANLGRRHTVGTDTEKVVSLLFPNIGKSDSL